MKGIILILVTGLGFYLFREYQLKEFRAQVETYSQASYDRYGESFVEDLLKVKDLLAGLELRPAANATQDAANHFKQSPPLPPLVKESVRSWGGKWWQKEEEVLWDPLDFSWMEKLGEFAYWERVDKDKVPSFEDLYLWGKLRLLKGKREGNLPAAQKEVHSLIHLLFSTSSPEALPWAYSLVRSYFYSRNDKLPPEGTYEALERLLSSSESFFTVPSPPDFLYRVFSKDTMPEELKCPFLRQVARKWKPWSLFLGEAGGKGEAFPWIAVEKILKEREKELEGSCRVSRWTFPKADFQSEKEGTWGPYLERDKKWWVLQTLATLAPLVLEAYEKKEGALHEKFQSQASSQSCSKDSPVKCHEQGIKEFSQGQGALGRLYFQKACQYDHQKSCLHLARQDLSQGYIHLSLDRAQRACLKDVAEGCLLQLRIYRETPVEEDPWPLLDRSCQLKEGVACALLAVQREKENQKDAALQLYQKACDFRFSPGCLLRGKLAELSETVEAAKKWYEKACQMGAAAGCQWVKAH